MILRLVRFDLDCNVRQTEDALMKTFYHDDFFSDRANSYDKSHFHSRFMQPYCERWEDKLDDPSRSELVFMMPYVHWELDSSYWEMRRRVRVIESEGQGSRSTDMPSFEHDLQENHVQIRRSLDQSVYWRLKDTTTRDRDQVINRYAKEYLGKQKEPGPILMVDQLSGCGFLMRIDATVCHQLDLK